MKIMLDYIQNEMMKYEELIKKHKNSYEQTKDQFMQKVYLEDIEYYEKQIKILGKMHSIIRNKKDDEEFHQKVLEQNGKLKDIIAFLKESFNIKLNERLNGTNILYIYCAGITIEKYLTDKEYDLVKEVFEEDE